MSNTKTGLEWLEMMPEPYQSQAREAIEAGGNEDDVLQDNFGRFSSFLSQSFIWGQSMVCQTYEDSRAYWNDFLENLPENIRD